MPSDWSAILSVSAKQVVRIFDGCNEASLARIGPDPLPASFVIPDLRSADLIYGIEALTFPGIESGADLAPAEIDLFLDIYDQNCCRRYSDRARFRIAPWLMVWNGMPATRLFIVATPDEPLQPGHPAPHMGNASVIQYLQSIFPPDFVVAFPINGFRLPGSFGSVSHKIDAGYAGDRWIQDWIAIGESHVPNQRLSVVIDSPQDPRKIIGINGLPTGPTYAQSALSGAHFAYIQQPGYRSSLDSFGNLAVSPPVTVNGKEYLFGRIYYGGAVNYQDEGGIRQIYKPFCTFLEAQVIQHPFEIDTSWLALGHVDEVVTFIPTNDTRGFKMLIASPRKALAIMRELQGSGCGDWTMLKGRTDHKLFSLEKTIDTLLTGFPTLIVGYNEMVQTYIDKVQAAMKLNIGLLPEDIIEIPVIYRRDPYTQRAIAYTANMVNLQVVVVENRNHLLIPKPFGPGDEHVPDLFETYVMEQLKAKGCSLHFIDTWYAYHLWFGEIHCGTNVLRSQRTEVSWWQQEK